MANVLRRIAEHELEKSFDGLSSDTRSELATSLVRQWIGNQGSAVLLTPDFQYRFHMRERYWGRTEVRRERAPQSFVDRMRKSQVAEEQIPSLLHELNVRQNVECVTGTGRKIRLRVDPRKPTYFVELVQDDE